MRAESQAALRWFGQAFTWVSLSVGIGSLLVPVFVSRPDSPSFILMGLAGLSLAYIVFRLYRRGVCTTGDALRLLNQLGFNTAVAPISNGNVEATLTFAGANSALWGGYAALGSTKYLTLKVPIAGASFGPVTIRKCSSQTSLLALRPQQYDIVGAGAVMAVKLQEAAGQLDYLDINAEATETALTIDVYGSFFNGPELRQNILNAVQLAASQQPNRGNGIR